MEFGRRNERAEEAIEARMLAHEAFEEALRSEDIEQVTTTYDTYERATFAATNLGKKGIEMTDGLQSLVVYADRARLVASEAEDSATEALFVGKATTFRNLLDTLQPKAVAEPRPTDTTKRSMGNKKSA